MVETKLIKAKSTADTKSGQISKVKKKPSNRHAKSSCVPFKACWRCKRYKKPCDRDTICAACLTTGFRVWPNSLGCRRGNLHYFAHRMVPEDIHVAFEHFDSELPKAITWRQISKAHQSDIIATEPRNGGDIWAVVLYLLKGTRIYGPGILELAQIGAYYQRKQDRKNIALDKASKTLYLVLQAYHSLILTDLESSRPEPRQIAKQFTAIREAIMQTLDRFQQLCLSGPLKAWVPAFLACSLGVVASVLLVDVIAALPPEVCKVGWPDLRQHVSSLRQFLYATVQDLLFALAKGSFLLDMCCWQSHAGMDIIYNEAPQASTEPERNPEGCRMMSNDYVAYDVMVSLVSWRGQFLPFLRGDFWMRTVPLEVDLLPIMSLSRLFISSRNNVAIESELLNGQAEDLPVVPSATISNLSNVSITEMSSGVSPQS